MSSIFDRLAGLELKRDDWMFLASNTDCSNALRANNNYSIVQLTLMDRNFQLQAVL